ncbi:MAG: sensor histidine kinase [Spirochaetaceae bacterium]|nr:MAG: sensor histidine kinase [Spirochaetaceae bacterium]
MGTGPTSPGSEPIRVRTACSSPTCRQPDTTRTERTGRFGTNDARARSTRSPLPAPVVYLGHMTIGGRIFLSLLALLLVPVLLLFGTGVAIRTYFVPTPTGSARDRDISDYLLVAGRVPSRLNRVLATDPDAIADGARLEEFALDHPTRGAVVARSGRVVATTSRFADLVGTPVDRIDGAIVGGGRGRDLTVFTVFSWDFRFTDESDGRFLYVGATGWADHRFWPGGSLLTIATIALLLVVNGTISWSVARKLVAPLRGLEEAARRVGDGRLDTELLPSGDREIRQVYRAFDLMRTKLAESLSRQETYERNRRELIAALSHDLRTPIAAIRGYVEGLRDGIPKDEAARNRYLATIDEKARLLDRLIGELFVYSRSDIEGVRLRRSNVDLAELARQVCTEAERLFDGLSSTVESGHPGALMVRADRDHLHRALHNIIENAVVHGGRDQVHVTVRIGVCVGVGAGGHAVIEICDSGDGIPAGVEERIFEGFFRADASRSSEHPGAGLGLAVVRQVVDAHGGTVRAANCDCGSPGGLCVTIELPIGSGA